MNELFEVTADDIAQLSDGDLRTLVGLLCEEEVRKRGLTTSAVRHGGSQDAPDGGLDVQVDLPNETPIDGWVPRPQTGFQVRKYSMPPRKIASEMRPKGKPRPILEQLASRRGAYVIVSSGDSTSGTMHACRVQAMQKAVAGLPNATAFKVEFYDRGRLATWVRDHAGLMLWVRNRAGRPLSGWQPFGPWADNSYQNAGEYLSDNKLRIHLANICRPHGIGSPQGLPALDGLHEIRELLRQPGRAVRLVGLSGVGKTRFTQALFEASVGRACLNPDLALYTNLSDDPNPQPAEFASQLIAMRKTGVLVIDNCRADLHARLAQICQAPQSTLSVITIEYDIHDDLPEETRVFRLDTSSPELIENLIRRRFKHISQVDANTITKFSDGNAKVALALAGTLRDNETVGDLRDDGLLRRFIQQRQPPDEALQLAAEVCSLVFSFNVDDVGPDSELAHLGSLVEQSALEMHRHVAELLDRGVTQRRGPWRAILPHAIANRLAASALRKIPASAIAAHLVHGAPERLMISFARRLGYLHSCSQAAQIVRGWLAEGGLLGDVMSADATRLTMLANIAPAAPEATLAALERDITPDRDLTAISHSATHIHLLRSLAYDADRFPRAARLLARVASSASATGQSNYAANALASLLQICYSGTRAPVEDRLALLGPLLESELPEGRELGLKALSSALEGWQFQPFQDFDFGAHSRDYGYWPKSEQEVRHWFATVLTFSARHARPSSPLSAKVRRIIADQLQGMWTGARVYDEIERTSHALSQAQYWPEGWQAAREVLYHHGSALPPTDLARLTALEQMLRPRDDAQKVRAVVLSRDHVGLYVADVADRDNLEETRAAVFATAEDLGARLAQDRPALADLLPDLTAGGAHVWEFGRGLFRGTTDAGDTWNKLIHAFLAAPEHQRNLQFLCGFTQAMSETNRPLANLLLDGLLENAAASLLPPLQSVAGVDEEGSARLTQCLSRNLAPIESYRSLAQAAATDDTPADKLKDIILTIAEKPGGFRVSCEILRGRLWADQKAKRGHHPRMLEVGRELVRQAPITEIRDQRDGLHLHEITRACLLGQEGANVAEEVCRKIVEAVAKHQAHPIYLGGLIGGLFAVQPSVALSGLFGQTHLEIDRGVTMFRNMHQNPVDGVPESNLLAWCDGDPRTRYPAVAKLITPLANEKWTDLALSILRHAPDRAKVLKQYVGRFELDRWRGSRADAIESRAKLLDILPDLNDSGLEKSVAESKDRLLKLAEEARREEAEAERRRNETFE